MLMVKCFFYGRQCWNPNLGLITKARACKSEGQKCSLGVTFHALGNVGECERMNPHTPKWTPTLGVGVPMNSWIFRGDYKGQNSSDWRISYTIEKILRHKCLKWDCMTHLNISYISYGQKKGWKSKCQFDFRPLKIRNRLDLLVCMWRVTRR